MTGVSAPSIDALLVDRLGLRRDVRRLPTFGLGYAGAAAVLVGDASGYVDALTGEGLRVGLAQARAAVALLDDPARYERAWRAVTRGCRVLTSAAVRWAGSPARRTIVPVAGRLPGLYGAVVERLAC